MTEKAPASDYERVKIKFDNIQNELEQIVNEASKKIHISIDGHLSIKIQNAALNQDIITANDRAQIIHFVTKYQELPEIEAIDLIERGGKLYVENLDFVKHLINEYRPIVSNRSDSIYYKNLFKYCASKLTLKDPTIGTTLTITKDYKEDITSLYLILLENNCDAIEYILNKSDMEYIYNGVLQHSDKCYPERLAKDYYTGELSYILVKNAYVIGHVKHLLKPFFNCAVILNPNLQMGAL